MGSVVFSFKLSFTLKSDCLEIGLNDRKSTLYSEVSSVLSTTLEKPKD